MHNGNGGSAPEYLEQLTVMFEWRISNLKQLFESSNGPNKSKCLKSALFGSNKWQIFFYPNSGHEQYCSLYLSCEPTLEERERGLRASALEGPIATGGLASGGGGSTSGSAGMGQWYREGLFKFTFETRSADKKVLFKAMEANDHAFNYEARNWGWAQFWQRNQAYFNNSQAKLSDCFVIICTIVYSPKPPTPPPILLKRLIPADLIDAYASLFDDPQYSDVIFRIREDSQGLLGGRKRKSAVGVRREKKIYASKKVLTVRSEYFNAMFTSGFCEGPQEVASADTSRSIPRRSLISTNSQSRPSSIISSPLSKRRASTTRASFIESDSEDEEREAYDTDELLEDEDFDEDESDFDLSDGDDDMSVMGGVHGVDYLGPMGVGAMGSEAESDGMGEEEETATGTDEGLMMENAYAKTAQEALSIAEPISGFSVITPALEEGDVEVLRQNTTILSNIMSPSSASVSDQQVSHPTSLSKESPPFFNSSLNGSNSKKRGVAKRHRTSVIVTDASYGTFRALLHYLYTDSIVFAPLASTYYCARDAARSKGVPFAYSSRKEFVKATIPKLNGSGSGTKAMIPCSAKAIYRLADKLRLLELRNLARDHIVKSLSAQTILYEVFGGFSRAFEEIKKVEMEVFLEKWNEVKGGETMKKVLRLLRSGRFPGFEEVFIAVVANLEYKPKEEGKTEEDDISS